MVLDEQPAQIKLIAYFVYFFLLVPFMVVYIDTWVAPILPQMFAYLSAYFYLHLSFCYCYMCSRKAVYLQWKMMRFAATVASVSARKKNVRQPLTHILHASTTNTFIFTIAKSDVLRRRTPMAKMWWREFNYDFHKFSTNGNAIRTNTSLRREPPSS